MNPYIQELNEWLAQQEQPNYGYANTHTVLQHLWHTYTECNPIENARTDALFNAMDPVLALLPIRAADHLFYKICDLMGEYGQSAFLTGIQIGRTASGGICGRAPSGGGVEGFFRDFP